MPNTGGDHDNNIIDLGHTGHTYLIGYSNTFEGSHLGIWSSPRSEFTVISLLSSICMIGCAILYKIFKNKIQRSYNTKISYYLHKIIEII